MENTTRWAAGRLVNEEDDDLEDPADLDTAGTWAMADHFSDAESLDAELLGPGGSCPPDSFLEGFTRHFVENYRPSQVLETDEVDEVVAIASLVSSERQRQQRQQQSSYYSPSSSASSSSRHYSPTPSIHQSPPSPLSHPVAPEEPQTPQDCQLRGTAAIDKHARRQLWGRIRRMGDTGGSSEAEERRIEELVRMAEALEIHHDGGSNGPRELPRVPIPIVAMTPQEPPIDRRSADDGDKREDGDRRAPDGECYWQPQEWIQWGSVVVVAEDDNSEAVRLPLDSHEMARRLESVHEMHPDAWRHGFRDLVLPNGKLQRTYSTQPVVLQAYPDGNVKRTLFAPAAAGSGAGSGSVVRAVTLYYANGDWSCSAPGLWCCYYYCHERVWHKQTD
ncbi:hypothetical protein IWW48_005717 [Coemansia sp. RSA 1200]|nr:hypothetical protein IWW48_005717 [Coemansia sp. RSA 1200]